MSAQSDEQNAPSRHQRKMTPTECKALGVGTTRQQEKRLSPADRRELSNLRKKWMEKMEALKSSIIKNSSPSKQKAFALDCEMVAVRIGESTKNVHKAAYVCVVDSEGWVVYRSYISQKHTIFDCMTWITGVRRQHLRGAPSLDNVQNELYDILKGNILVGHGLKVDLQSLEMQHPISDQRDTQAFFMRNLPYGERKTNLKLMAYVHLGLEIQHSSHDPAEDAFATMDLYSLFKDQVDAQAVYHYCHAGEDDGFDEYDEL